MEFCLRHEQQLVNAISLRGLTRAPSLDARTFQPLEHARAAIASHATNLAGRASVEMCTGTNGIGEPWCPLCFINLRNPSGLRFDDWVDLAADDALSEDIARTSGREVAMSP